MPLMSSSFTPGQAQATVNSFQDKGQRQIAQAELYYFSARAEECKDIAELYLQDKDIYLRLSAGLLYSFSNLTLGNLCTRQNRTHHQMKQWLPAFSPTIWLWCLCTFPPTNCLRLEISFHICRPACALMESMFLHTMPISTKNTQMRWDCASLSFSCSMAVILSPWNISTV